MTFTHSELGTIGLALTIARLQMKTNGAIMKAMEQHSAATLCDSYEKDFAELASRVLKATTQ